MAHIEYIKTEDVWFGLHYVKNIPYATMGSKIAKGKYRLRRKGGKTPNLYLWRNDPEPMLEEENISEIPTILQTAEASLVPEDIETIIQGIAAIPTTNQPMDDEECHRRDFRPQDEVVVVPALKESRDMLTRSEVKRELALR